MFWFAIILIISIVAIYYYNIYFILPVKISKWYKNTLQALDYKVLVYPYQPFKILLNQNQNQNQRLHGDAFYDEKNNWHNYDVVITNTNNQITLILINSRLMKYFFSPQKNSIFPKSYINKYGFKLVLGNTMILNEGEEWKNKRKVISQIFNFDFIKRNVPKMKEIAELMINHAQENSEIIRQTQQERQFKLQLKPIFQDIISNIVIKCFFGSDCYNRHIDGLTINKYLSKILKQARDQSTDPLVMLLGERAYEWGLTARYRNLMVRINRIKSQVRGIIGERMGQLGGEKNNQRFTDILQAMFYLKSKQNNDLTVLDENQIVQQFCAFMTAGNDSTSLFTNMIMYYLSQNARVETKLRKLISNHIKTVQDITYQNLKKIQYLQWIQMQTNRMYGPATSIMLREAAKDTYIDNVPIRKGTGIKIELMGNHYNKKYFSKPFQFQPERWENTEEIDKHPYAFGGFSFGARTCLGKQLAYIASKIIVVMLLIRYQTISIDECNKIIFQVKSFYTPSPFFSNIVGIKQK